MHMPKLPENWSVVNSEPLPVEHTVQDTLRIARDSVWVIEEELKLEYFRLESLSLLEANVGHLEIVVNSDEVKNSNEDYTDLVNAISLGKQAITILKN